MLTGFVVAFILYSSAWIANTPEPVQVTYACTATLMDGTEVPCAREGG